MVVKHATDISGHESTGSEEVTTQASHKLGGLAANAARLGAAILGEGAQALSDFMEKKRQERKTAPELRGNLYKDLSQAFVDNGVPQDVAEEAAAGLVQGEDADNNPAIAAANKIVSQETTPQLPVTAQTVQAKEPIGAADELDEALSPEESVEDAQEEEARNTQQGRGAVSLSAPSAVKASSKQPPQPKAASVTPVPTVVEKASAAQPSKNVQIEQKPSEMKWPQLQKTAGAITKETGAKPASGKRVDVEPFVESYRQEQQKEQEGERKTIAAPPVTRVEIQKTTETGLKKDYSSALEAAGADSKIAKEASSELVSGKGADNNSAISQANSQVKQAIVRSKLHQMYYDVLSKQKSLSPELAELASKDLAAGKGAHSSRNIKVAHDRILDRELEKSGHTPDKKKWIKYSRYVTEQNSRKRDSMIAAAAIKDGVEKKSVKSMILYNSPVAATIQMEKGGTAMATYADQVASSQKGLANSKKLASRTKGVTPVKKQKKGLEV